MNIRQDKLDKIQQKISELTISEKLALIKHRAPEFVDASQEITEVDQKKLDSINLELDELTSEINALIKQLEEKYGVTAAAMSFGSGAGAEAEETVAAPVKDFIKLKELKDAGKKMEVIKNLRELLKSGHTENPDKKTEYSLMECKAMVESMPIEIKFKNTDYIPTAIKLFADSCVVEQ